MPEHMLGIYKQATTALLKHTSIKLHEAKSKGIKGAEYVPSKEEDLASLFNAIALEAHLKKAKSIDEDKHITSMLQKHPEMEQAWASVRIQVKSDNLPVLPLLTAEPSLTFQFPHLTFQEFYCMDAITKATNEEIERWPKDKKPSEWDAWWDNVVQMGETSGAAFGERLVRMEGLMESTQLKILKRHKTAENKQVG